MLSFMHSVNAALIMLTGKVSPILSSSHSAATRPFPSIPSYSVKGDTFVPEKELRRKVPAGK